jgi:hypothetical protein
MPPKAEVKTHPLSLDTQQPTGQETTEPKTLDTLCNQLRILFIQSQIDELEKKETQNPKQTSSAAAASSSSSSSSLTQSEQSRLESLKDELIRLKGSQTASSAAAEKPPIEEKQEKEGKQSDKSLTQEEKNQIDAMTAEQKDAKKKGLESITEKTDKQEAELQYLTSKLGGGDDDISLSFNSLYNNQLLLTDLIAQSGGNLEFDGVKYQFPVNNAPLNLLGGYITNNNVDEITPEQDELLYKAKYIKYRQKYIALKRR